MADVGRRSWPALELTYTPSFDAVSDAVVTAVHELDASGLEECACNVWRVYFATADARDRARAVLRDTLAPIAIEVRPLDIADERWAERTQAHVRAIRVGRLTIAPPWDVPADEAPEHIIVIEPSTGFGTGHHPSTRLCLLALQDAVLTGQRVLDLGTGSGILALAAMRLGAAAVTAIDTDPDALDAVRANLARDPNADAIEVVHADFRELVGMVGDVVVANITGAFLIAAAATLRALVTPGGALIVSGFTTDEEAAVRSASRGVLRVAARYDEDGWIALRMVRALADSEIAPDELQYGDGGDGDRVGP